MFKPDLKSLPKNPGVYIYKDSLGKIIYVGKAKNLKNRVATYFNKSSDKSPKTKILVSNISDMEYIVVDNEVEALLLENRLIKKNNPKYNINLKDSKTYAYIKISNDKFARVTSSRKVRNDGEYFGPYVDGMQRKELIRLIVKIFKLRTCRKLPKRECLNYHIGICTAPCVGKVSEKDYNVQVKEAIKLLNGNTKDVLKKLKDDMLKASSEMKYELAMEKKNHIEAIMNLQEKQKVDLVKDYDQDFIGCLWDDDKSKVMFQIFNVSRGVIQGRKQFKFDYDENIFEEFIKMYYSQNYVPKEIVVNKNFWMDDLEKDVLEGYLSTIRGSKVSIVYPKRGEKLGLIKMVENNIKMNFSENDVLGEIKDKLNLSVNPDVIECFDISNLGYDYVVAGMTRWVNGEPDKNGNRRFEIKSFKGKNDDFRSMREVIYRRYSAIKEGRECDGVFPDLIIVDGGKGQLASAMESLNRLNLKIPIISLAKKEEEIFMPEREDSLRFDKNSRMMLFIRRVRDSVHNYVITYNRKKRSMRLKDDFEKK